jgi:branched-chain amino acid transport system substrate-binding protein
VVEVDPNCLDMPQFAKVSLSRRPARRIALARGALAALVVLALSACQQAAGPVVFGAAGKWDTGYGAMSKRGSELAVTEINAAGGIGGDSLVLRLLDDQANGAVAAAVADSLVNDPRVLAVVGHLASGAMVAAAPVYDAGQLPAVATTATSPDLTGISPWVFRVVPSDSASAMALAAFATTLGRQRAAVLYENDAYGRGLADAFRRAYRGRIVSMDPIAPDRADFEPFLAWFKQQNVDLVFVAGTEGTGIPFVKQARAAGLTADLLGADGWAPVTQDPAAEGIYVGVPFAASDPRPAAKQFVSAFKTRYGMAPDNNAALAYDAVKLVARAVSEAGRDRSKIRAWLASGQSVEGATGTIRLGANGDPDGKGIRITRATNGALELVARR